MSSFLPYANVYPQDQDDLIDRLPLLCDAAQKLINPLIDRALQDPKIEVYAANKGWSASEFRASYKDEDPEGIKDRLAACALGKYTEIRLGIPLDNRVLSVCSYMSGVGTEMSVEVSLDLPATGYNGRLSQLNSTNSQELSSTSLTKIDDHYRLASSGGVTRNNPEGIFTDYWLGYSFGKNRVSEIYGSPIVNPALTLSNHQQEILTTYGLYGLIYDDTLTHLRLMQALSAPSKNS
jgi:hypothetical protein